MIKLGIMLALTCLTVSIMTELFRYNYIKQVSEKSERSETSRDTKTIDCSDCSKTSDYIKKFSPKFILEDGKIKAKAKEEPKEKE